MSGLKFVIKSDYKSDKNKNPCLGVMTLTKILLC